MREVHKKGNNWPLIGPRWGRKIDQHKEYTFLRLHFQLMSFGKGKQFELTTIMNNFLFASTGAFKYGLPIKILAQACGVPAVGVRAVDCWQ